MDRPVYRPGVDLVGTPSCVYCPVPQYSGLATRYRGQGSTVIDVLVSPQGTTVAMRPMQLIGCGVDEQVLKIVKTWSFKPARAEGIHGAVRFPCWFLTSP